MVFALFDLYFLLSVRSVSECLIVGQMGHLLGQRAVIVAAAAAIAWSSGAPACAAPAANTVDRAMTGGQTAAVPRAAIEAIRSGDSAAALEILRREHDDETNGQPALVQLADLLRTEGQSEASRMTLEEAVVLHPHDPEAHLALADLAWRQRRLSDADLQYRHARKLIDEMGAEAPRRTRLLVWALAGLGSVAEARGQLDAARQSFEELLTLEAAHPQTRFRLASIAFASHDPDTAYAHLREMQPGQAQPAAAEMAMADLYKRAGDLDRAEQWLHRAAEAAPDAVAPQLALAQLLLDSRNNLAAAAEHIAAARELEPDATQPQMFAALAAWSRGELAAAEEILEPLAVRAPDDAVLSAYLASVLAERGGEQRTKRALELAALNASSHPESAAAMAAYGWAAYATGQTALARRQLNAAVQADGSDRDARYYLAKVLYRSGQANAARQQLQAALGGAGRFVHLGEARTWGRELGLATGGE